MANMKDPGSSYAIFQVPLLADSNQHYGLAAWREFYGSARTANSVYRSPKHNATIHGALGSAHMRGVAADLNNATLTTTEWNAMVVAAESALASYIEPSNGPCKLNCTHADWRWWVYWPR